MKNQYNIADYGAIGDGSTLNTSAIQLALDTCADAGGGTVLIPPGTFLCGSIRMRSHTTLHLTNGAVLKASGNLQDYPATPFHHNEFGIVKALLWGIDATGIAITGEGEINLNDEPFMLWETIKAGDTFEEEMIARLDSRQRAESAVVAAERLGQCIFFLSVTNLSISGVTFKQAPAWCLCIHSSDFIRIQGISIINSLLAPNSDGIHMCSCRDAIITGCIFHCGDDCVAITGISDWDRETTGIVVSNCTMISRSAAVRIGHLQSKIDGVILTNLNIRDSQRGICIFTGDGGCIRNVIISNCVIQTRLICGHWWGNGEPFVFSAADSTGTIRNVRINNVIADSENGILIYGSNGNISGVHFRQLDIILRYGINRPLLGTLIDLQPAKTRPAPDATKSIPWLYLRETGQVTFSGVTATRHPTETVAFSLQCDIDDSPVKIEDCTGSSQ